ncbi:hypothetical protein [Bradyrhizobium sp. McL0615]|uniref:hypothetical protein n=1 Tax=Bradyrhizobium sp. McL0615 TaxID=3415673 RepID=UPI003CF25BD4
MTIDVDDNDLAAAIEQADAEIKAALRERLEARHKLAMIRRDLAQAQLDVSDATMALDDAEERRRVLGSKQVAAYKATRAARYG